MLKARKSRKWISILVTLVFLFSLLPAAALAADTTYGKYTSAYKYISTGTEKNAGFAQVTEKDPGGTDAWGAETYVKVTLPDGVTYNTKAKADTVKDYVTVNSTAAVENHFVDSSSNSVQVKVYGSEDANAPTTVRFLFDGDACIDVDSDVSGEIKATIEVMGVSGGSILWAESQSVTIAKVQAKEVSVTAGTPKIVEVGTEAKGSTITIKESQPGGLVKDNEDVVIYLQIETPDVTWDTAMTEVTSNASLTLASNQVTLVDDEEDLAKFTVTGKSHAIPAKVEIVPYFNVPPSVDGDIKVTVYKHSGDSDLKKTSVTVATIGEASATIEDVKDNDGTLYAGRQKTLDTSFKLETVSGDFEAGKLVVLDIEGAKFVDVDGISDKLTFKSMYNSDKTAWYTVNNNPGDTIKLEDFTIKADADAEPGDVVIKVSGSAGASGEVVIAKVKKPFSVTADTPYVQMGKGQAAGEIVITETGDGAIPAGQILVKLPDGVSFDGTPSKKVMEGNIKVDVAVVDGDLELDITKKSGIASEFKIYNIKYNVGRLALDEDIEVKFVPVKPNNVTTDTWASDKTLATVANATLISATKRDASFVVGESTYTVGGVEYTMDQASYVKNGRSYLPVRFAAYALGVTPENILYDGGNVTMLKGDKVVQVTLGSTVLKINGIAINMDVAPELSAANRTMLPFRWIAQAFGAEVGFDDATKTVTMSLK